MTARRAEPSSIGAGQNRDEVAAERIGDGVVAGHAARGRILRVGLHRDVGEILVRLVFLFVDLIGLAGRVRIDARAGKVSAVVVGRRRLRLNRAGPLRRPGRDLPERPFRQLPYAGSVGPRKRVQNASTA